MNQWPIETSFHVGNGRCVKIKYANRKNTRVKSLQNIHIKLQARNKLENVHSLIYLVKTIETSENIENIWKHKLINHLFIY